jgi:hypothetical protein
MLPIAVQLLLEQEGHYALTDTDRAACVATDLLLAEAQWVAGDDGRSEGRWWHEVLQKTTRCVQLDAIWERYKAVIQEVLTAHFFMTQPHYLKWMLKLKDVELRI